MNCSYTHSCTMCYGTLDIVNACHNVCISCIRIPCVCPVCGIPISGLTVEISKCFRWIYEGRNNGWWFFEPELQRTLTQAYESGKKHISWYLRSCAQTIYLDLEKMEQTNPNTAGVRRIVYLEHEKHHPAPAPAGYLIKGIGGHPLQKMPTGCH
jgi:hypothetical protein